MYCFLFDYPKLNNDTKRGCHFNVLFGLYTTYNLQNYALKLVYSKSFRHIHLICALLTLQDFAMLVLHCFISGNKYARHKTWRT